MAWVVVPLLVLLYVVYRAIWAARLWRGLPIEQGDCADCIECLMRAGFGLRGARYRFRHRASGRYVDFVKVGPIAPGRPQREPTRFFMELTDASCSEAELFAARDALTGAGIDWELSSELPQCAKVLTVECGPDIEKASHALEVVLREVYGLAPEEGLVACFKGGLYPSHYAMLGWDEPPPGPMPTPPQCRRTGRWAFACGRGLARLLQALGLAKQAR